MDPIFVKDDVPARFFILRGITDEQREILEQKIVNHRGKIVYEQDEEFDCILVKEELLHEYREKYQHSRSVYVEPLSFVNKCIKNNQYLHTAPIKKALGGRIPGSGRHEYTPSDDEHLAEYIAIKIPVDEAGGRQGNNIYKLLTNSYDVFPWATKHTWQSWRNRYKRHKARMDEKIDFYVKHYHPPDPNGKGQYHMDRRNKGIFRVPEQSEDREEEEEEEEEDEVRIVNEGDHERAVLDDATVVPPAAENNIRKRNRGVGSVEDEILEVPRQMKQRELAPRASSASASTSGLDVEGSVHDYDVDMELNFPLVVTDLFESRDISPEIEEAPLNTQVTLVEDAIRMKFGDNERPKATPTRAARNEKRARKEKEERARKEKEEQALQEVAERVKAARARTADNRTTAKESAIQPTSSQSRDQHQQMEPEVPIVPSQKTIKIEKAARKTIAQPAPVPHAAGPSQATRGAQKKATTKEQTTAKSKSTFPPIEVMRKAFIQEESEQEPLLAMVSEAPFRNTRARSRSLSVEPQVLPPPKKKGRKQQALKSVSEDVEDVDIQENIGEVATYQDDDSVDAVEDVLGSGVHDGESEEPPKGRKQQVEKGEAESGEEEETGHKATESDDEEESSANEIDRKYAERVRKLNLHTVTTTSSPDQGARNGLKDSNSGRPSILPAPSPFARQLTVTPGPAPVQSARGSSIVSHPSARATPKVKKFKPGTSESDFPASGTQARREKARRAERLKRQPYQPPAMTKAAAIVREKKPSRSKFAT